MLKINICKQCVKSSGEDWDERLTDDPRVRWQNRDMAWQEGFMLCPDMVKTGFHRNAFGEFGLVDAVPPAWCPYWRLHDKQALYKLPPPHRIDVVKALNGEGLEMMDLGEDKGTDKKSVNSRLLDL